MSDGRGGTWFQRYLLPGLAFKAAVIGGGYATGRELAEFFLPSGPQGGVLAILLGMLFWSLVCMATFALAQKTRSFDYRSFFHVLLGPAWFLFEIAYVLFSILVLAVFGAAAGSIGEALFAWPQLAGTLILIVAICGVAAYGNVAVERLFKWVSFFLYGVYFLFVILAFGAFGSRITGHLATFEPMSGWVSGGLTYASYNVVGAVIVLPVLRHMRSTRDAVTAGALSGPLAMIPALLFFLCMVAYYPEISAEKLPSDFLLRKLNFPAFHFLFQAMIFLALLESGTGFVHAINERVAWVYASRVGRPMALGFRLGITGVVLVFSIFLAQRYGLVTLIGKGYRILAYVILAIFVLPVMTLGVRRLFRQAVDPTLGA